MSKEKIVIWGRELELEVKYDCYTGEDILESQKVALSAFLESDNSIDTSVVKVKKYCLEQNREEIGEEITNIFKYVAPKYLYIARNTDKNVVAIMCNYKFDPENGIAVVFENEKYKMTGKQDIVL